MERFIQGKPDLPGQPRAPLPRSEGQRLALCPPSTRWRQRSRLTRVTECLFCNIVAGDVPADIRADRRAHAPSVWCRVGWGVFFFVREVLVELVELDLEEPVEQRSLATQKTPNDTDVGEHHEQCLLGVVQVPERRAESPWPARHRRWRRRCRGPTWTRRAPLPSRSETGRACPRPTCG